MSRLTIHTQYLVAKKATKLMSALFPDEHQSLISWKI